VILAIVTEEIDELGRRRYVAKLAELVDPDEEKPYGMMGLVKQRRSWGEARTLAGRSFTGLGC